MTTNTIAAGLPHTATPTAPPRTRHPIPPRVAAATAVAASKVYGSGDTQVVAIDQANVAFAEGQMTAIMGPSGSGKSTLMHCMAGLDRLSSGHVYIGDTDLSTLNEKQLTRLRRDRIGFVFQAFNLIPTLTARENITLPMDLGRRKIDHEWVDYVIDIVGLRSRLNHRPSELSGGQQQRVAVARALANRPDIVFADEPTGNLDSATGEEVLAFMRRAVHELGHTIVMVTHDPKAASFTDRVVFLADGQIIDELHAPSADTVLDRMRSLV